MTHTARHGPSRSRVWLAVLAACLAAEEAHAQHAPSGARAERPARAARATEDSVRRAVQAFYGWYVPRAVAHDVGPAWMRALRERHTLFAPAIVAALRRDSAAGARSPDEVVGLDGDPFLNAQDPCARYVVRRVARAGGRFLVDVVGEGGCAPHTRPDVVAEVARVSRGWRFENFRYPEPPDDLLALQRRLHPR